MAIAEADARSPLADALRQILGNDNVLTDADNRRFYSSDVYREAAPAEIVIRPGGTEDLQRAVKAATLAGYAVFPRGGGLSYTDGYLPDRQKAVMVDLLRLKKIIEINAEDMYVTVEPAVSWAELYEALKVKGVRTPYFGALSGLYSTVGGAMSQNSLFFGSGTYGTAADQCLGLEVALADGRLIKTGSGATPFNPTPFFRTYGPDLTGLFLGDAGALGLKVKITLKLIRAPAVTKYASFVFDEPEQIAAAMSEIARQQLAVECFGFDPFLQAQRLKRAGLIKDIKSLAGVARSGRGLLDGVKEAARVALAGRRMFEGVNYSMHLVIEGRDEAVVDSQIAAARQIAAGADGKEIENSLPKIMRGTPFVEPQSMLGPDGQRWVPIHAMVPHSRANKLLNAVHDYFDSHNDLLEKNRIEWGYLLSTCGAQVFLMEPVFFWLDARHYYHERYLGADYISKLKTYPADTKARETVHTLRRGLAKLFMEMGATHFQIGKSYLYREGREPETYKLLEALKDYVDPQRLMNPGSLGLK